MLSRDRSLRAACLFGILFQPCQKVSIDLARFKIRMRQNLLVQRNRRVDSLNHVRSTKSVKELRDMASQLRLAVDDMRTKCGVRASQAQLLGLMAWLER